tara:strand:+ start:180 stop:434 length:255 start_codon:yes stop_codon:yes gene_type:complete
MTRDIRQSPVRLGDSTPWSGDLPKGVSADFVDAFQKPLVKRTTSSWKFGQVFYNASKSAKATFSAERGRLYQTSRDRHGVCPPL